MNYNKIQTREVLKMYFIGDTIVRSYLMCLFLQYIGVTYAGNSLNVNIVTSVSGYTERYEGHGN